MCSDLVCEQNGFLEEVVLERDICDVPHTDEFVYGLVDVEESLNPENETSDSLSHVGNVSFYEVLFYNSSDTSLSRTECNSEDEYSLEDAIRAHESNVELRDSIKEKVWYDHVANGLGIAYYAFVFYSCPVAGISLGALKTLKHYGALNDVCNEQNSLMGYTACDVAEEAFYSHALFYAGGNLVKVLQGSTEMSALKALAVGLFEKLVRKTAFSNSRIKSDEFRLPDSGDYVPNVAYVAVSEVAEISTEMLLPGPLHKMAYKTAGRLAKQMTKSLIKDGSVEVDYFQSFEKSFVITACSVILPSFKSDLSEAHLYGHCLSAVGHLVSTDSSSRKAIVS